MRSSLKVLGQCKIFILSFCTHPVVDFLGRLWNRGTHPQPNCQNLCFYRNAHTCWWSIKIKCTWLAAPGCSYQSIRGELFTGPLWGLSFSHDCVHHSLSLALGRMLSIETAALFPHYCWGINLRWSPFQKVNTTNKLLAAESPHTPQ